METCLRITALCLALASAETLHGVIRAAVLVPRIGKARALQVSIVSGSLLAYLLCAVLVPPIGITSGRVLLALGLLLAGFMATFDIVLGRLVLKRPWKKIFEEFDPRSGNYLLVGLLLLISFPYLVMRP